MRAGKGAKNVMTDACVCGHGVQQQHPIADSHLAAGARASCRGASTLNVASRIQDSTVALLLATHSSLSTCMMEAGSLNKHGRFEMCHQRGRTSCPRIGCIFVQVFTSFSGQANASDQVKVIFKKAWNQALPRKRPIRLQPHHDKYTAKPNLVQFV